MTVVKRLAALAVAGLLVGSLAGCGRMDAPANPDDTNSWRIAYVHDPKTGHDVRCAINDYSDKSGISCDWAGAK